MHPTLQAEGVGQRGWCTRALDMFCTCRGSLSLCVRAVCVCKTQRRMYGRLLQGLGVCADGSEFLCAVVQALPRCSLRDGRLVSLPAPPHSRPSLSLTRSLALSLARALPLSFSLSPPLPLCLSLVRSLSLALSRCRSRSRSRACARYLSLARSLCRSLSFLLSVLLSLRLFLSLRFSLSRSRSLSASLFSARQVRELMCECGHSVPECVGAGAGSAGQAPAV